MAAFATSSHGCPKQYDVFISFKGSDVRDGFLSHLTKHLRHEGIDVYIDERLERGNEISSELLKAIERSIISLVIFSKDYASSRWCLEELVKIMECKRDNGQIVIPVFYNVDPSNVRHQDGFYADAFTDHEIKFKDDIEKVQIWRSILTKAADSSGHPSSNVRKESDFIDEIIQTVSKKLEDIDTIIEPKHLMIGYQKNMSAIVPFMKDELREVGILGIWGKGGIGKTTLARAIFDKFSRHFPCSYFASNVREESKKIGLPSLLDKIICALLNDANLTMKGRPNSQRRLRRKRVLLVLDDVDSYMQLHELIAEEKLSLGPNSKVIITSRDKHVLISGGVHAVHEVQELNMKESLQLFCRHAFKQTNPQVGYEKLSMQAIQYAGGLPLALEVLGSHLNSRDIKTWVSALENFRKHPNVKIETILRVSYDELNPREKRTFLDISFFFRGAKKEDIIRVLDACNDLYSNCVIDDLVDKALITISKDNTIEIHDLLHEMAQNIVSEKFPHHPERRSRLNNAEEIEDVLINNKGTHAIEGILLEYENLSFTANSFRKMRNLRFLKIQPQKIQPHQDQMESLFQVGGHKISYPNGLDSLSNNLRYFDWERYPFKSLPLGYCPEKLVEIHLSHSPIEKLWSGVQDLRNLKKIVLTSSELKELPDFSMACNLESIDLTLCDNLRSIHPSILSLPNLVYLWLSHCFKLKVLHGDNHMKSLKHLVLTGCFRLEKFLLSSEEMTSLDLADTGIKILNLPIGRFNKLEELNLGRLKQFKINELCCLTSLKKFSLSGFIDKSKLVILFDAWHSLEELYLTECDLSEIPDNISALSSLKILSLQGSNVESLPSSIMNLSGLKLIDLSKCYSLRYLLELPPSTTHLYVEDCTSLGAINFTMMQAISYNKASEAKFCYPGGKIPKGFKYSQTKGRFIAIELLSSSSNHLLGFVCCCILSPGDYYTQTSIWRIFHFEDEEIIYKDEYPFSGLGRVTADNVYIWYDPLEHILKRSQRRKIYDEGTTYKFTCEFVIRFYHNHPLFCADHPDPPIEVCGLCPIYASDLQEMDQEMELINLEISGNVSTPNAELSQHQPSPDEFWKYLAFEPQGIKENVQTVEDAAPITNF